MAVCPKCKGRRKIEEDIGGLAAPMVCFVNCDKCDGTGEVSDCVTCGDSKRVVRKIDCPDCTEPSQTS